MSNSDKKIRTNTLHVFAGVLLLVTGGAAALQALNFDTESKMFPLVIASLLALSGLAIAAKAILRPSEIESTSRKFIGVMWAAATIAAWGIAFAAGAGFILPTFAMQVLLIWLMGIRQPAYLIAVAALITALAYLLFVFALDIPLPPSILPAALQDF